MHTFKASHGTVFNFNSDLSGSVYLKDTGGNEFSLDIPDLFEFLSSRGVAPGLDVRWSMAIAETLGFDSGLQMPLKPEAVRDSLAAWLNKETEPLKTKILETLEIILGLVLAYGRQHGRHQTWTAHVPDKARQMVSSKMNVETRRIEELRGTDVTIRAI